MIDRNISIMLDNDEPLPNGTELLSKDGIWEKLSETALMSANRLSFSYAPHAWLVSWNDLFERLRYIPEPEDD